MFVFGGVFLFLNCPRCPSPAGGVSIPAWTGAEDGEGFILVAGTGNEREGINWLSARVFYHA